MNKLIKSIALLGSVLFLAACGERVQVPVAHYGKIPTTIPTTLDTPVPIMNEVEQKEYKPIDDYFQVEKIE